MVVTKQGWIMPGNDSEAVAEFIRTKGITRCPTACVLPTQGLVAAADRVALEEHAIARDRSRRAQAAARWRPFLNFKAQSQDGRAVARLPSWPQYTVVITLVAACGWYELSIEEFRVWESKLAPRSALSTLAIDLLTSINPQDDHNLAAKT
jgi:hypothetical protein